MTVRELCGRNGFEPICGGNSDRSITGVYCGDLLSNVMVKAPKDCAWVTVIGNINSAAVAYASNAACIVLAEGASADKAMLDKAREHEINVVKTDLPVFEAALEIYTGIN